MKNILDKSTTSGKVLQILIGVILVYCLFLFAGFIMGLDKFEDSGKEKMEKMQVDILDGFADSSSLSLVSYNTVLPYVDNYLPLKPSVNIKGGTQFTFSFWLNASDIMNTSLLNRGIFMVGDKKRYKYSITEVATSVKTDINDFLTFCPYFGFGANSLDFVVRFNTSNKTNEQLYANRMTSENESFRNNIMSILRNNWMMFTITFEDNIPMNDFENGIRVQMYLNDIMYQNGQFKGMLKQNKGNLIFFPDGSLDGIRLANMKYFNYAISSQDVKSLYSNPPNTSKPASLVGTTSPMKVNIASKNLLNYYNMQ